MKNNIFIFHGAYGNPEENWFPWLKGRLEKLGYKVFVPKFPTPEKQTLENWRKVFKKHEKQLNPNTVYVGHSLGVAFILNILEKIKGSIKASFLVSGFIDPLDNPEFDKINKTFISKPFEWRKIKRNCRAFVIFHSDNDQYVPLEKANKLADKLGVKITLIKNAGHFNKESGYTSFNLLLKEIKRLGTNGKLDELLAEFRKLKFPDGQYAIYGSGPLGVRGIRETNDLDVIVTDNLYQKLKRKYPVDSEWGRIRIGEIEIYPCWAWEPKISGLEKAIKRAETIQGLRFICLEDLMVCKKRMVGEKHAKDVRSIKKYLDARSRA